MSVIETIQKLFKPKSIQPEDSMDMASLGTPADPLATSAMHEDSLRISALRQENGSEGAFAPSRMATPEEEDAAVENSDLLRLPLLGRRTIGQHQRILVTALALAVAVLG